MFGALFRPLARRGFRRAALVAGAVAVAGLVAWCCRGSFVHRATAQPAPAGPARPQQAAATASASDYDSRIVAFVFKTQSITRQELGEFLVERLGVDKLPLLINKRIVDMVCQQRGIVVTAAEVDAALGAEMKDLAVDRQSFLKSLLARYRKNLYEFKEDIIRPRLQLTRLVQPTLTVSEDDLRKAYDMAYGEKVECRIILWPRGQEQKAVEEYRNLQTEPAFAEAAKRQVTPELASQGGKINPICRFSMDPKTEGEVFKLRKGQFSPLVATPEGTVMFWCDNRIPADTAVNLAAVRNKLDAQVRDRKLLVEMGNVFQMLQKQANPQVVLKKTDRPTPGAAPSSGQVVATIHGNIHITREDLGEFLISRYGGEKLESLVIQRVLDRVSKERNVTVSEEDLDRTLKADLNLVNIDTKHFESDLLARMGVSLYEWREDHLRRRLILGRLCQGRVKCSEEDIKRAFEANYGERLVCRMILYPPGQEKFAQKEYARLRDSASEFDRKARSQASSSLASKAGKLDKPVGRSALGNEDLEREAFRLQPGELTPLVGTPHGLVVLKCDQRIPPDPNVKLEQVRADLLKETTERKTQIEMQVVFKELMQKAEPKMLLKGTGQPEDLMAETKKLMTDLPPLVPQRR
jgi:parvulin-like peptidyl-prolyl isomerase